MSYLSEFRQLPDDKTKWQWVAENQDKSITVNLDNDETFITIDGEDGCGEFNEYIGDSAGISILLESVGINAERV